MANAEMTISIVPVVDEAALRNVVGSFSNFNVTSDVSVTVSDPESREDQLQAFVEQYREARRSGSPHDLNAVWERGKALGLEQGGRVTIPSFGGEQRSEQRDYQEPKDIFGHPVRVTKKAEISVRAVEDEDGETGEFRLQGYAAKFNRETVIGWWYKFRETIAPGAFTKTIGEADVRHLFNHDPNWVLGRNKSGTLILGEDKVGLSYDVELNSRDPQAVTVRETVLRGDVDQSSFAFIILRELWEEPDDPDGGELPLRTILEAKLFDTSTVTYPAYEDTTALIASGARSAILRQLGVTDELAGQIANERFTPDAADALRSVAQQAEELAARCEDGAPCPRAAEKAPADGTADEPADEESPDGTEGTDRESDVNKDVLIGDQDSRNKQLLARLAGIPSNIGGE